MFNNIHFLLKQNRVLKRLARLETDRNVTTKVQSKASIQETDVEKLNNNVEPIKQQVTKDASNKFKDSKPTPDPYQLPIPGDYDDYWYRADDGEWYNEYDDELEEGYYYQKEKKLPSWCTDSSLAIPKPADYEDYWYEADDGQWYNEYDDELLEGQYYVDKVDDKAAEKQKAEDEQRKAAEAKKAEEQRKADEARKKAEEEARKAKEAAEKAAKEAAKAAEEAAKEAQAAAKKMMQGFGGGLFGSKQDNSKKSSGIGLGSMFGSAPAQDKKSPQPVSKAPPSPQPSVKPAQQQDVKKPEQPQQPVQQAEPVKRVEPVKPQVQTKVSIIRSSLYLIGWT